MLVKVATCNGSDAARIIKRVPPMIPYRAVRVFIKFLISVPLVLSLPELQVRQQSFQSSEQQEWPAEQGMRQKRASPFVFSCCSCTCCSRKPRDKTCRTRGDWNLLTSRTHGIVSFSSWKSGFCSLSQPRKILLHLFQHLKIQIHDNLRI